MNDAYIFRVVAEGGKWSDLGLGTLHLEFRSDATRWRVALHEDDLPSAHWTTVTALEEFHPWIVAGFQEPYPSRAFVEIEHTSGPNEIVKAREAGGARTPGVPAWPSLSVNNPSGYILKASCATGPIWPLHHYCDDAPYPHGNVFIPLMWHSSGYGWATSNTWGIDVGETPDDVIIARITARQFDIEINNVDLSGSGVSIHAWTQGNNLDLKGGYVCFAVVCSFPDGKRGRYHLRRASPLGTSSFAESAWGLPSGSHADWQCSFAANGVGIGNMPNGPDLRYVEEIDIIARDWTSVPIGEFRIQEVSVQT